MHLYKLILVMFIALPLLGLGCKKSAPGPAAEPIPDAAPPPAADADAGIKLPEGWKVYKSEEWQLSFAYPPKWNVHEAKLTDGNLTVFLDPRQIPEELPPEPLFAVTIMATRNSLERILAQYNDQERLTTLRAGDLEWERYRYFSELLDQYDITHLRSFEDIVVLVLADESVSASPELRSILQQMEVR